jgi:hypothetical protein
MGHLRPTTNKDSTTARGTALPTLRDFDPAYDLSGPNLRLRTRMGFAVASRILKGEKPTDCRFCRATRFEQTMLGIELPPTLLGPRTSVAIRPSFVAVHDSGGARTRSPGMSARTPALGTNVLQNYFHDQIEQY